MRRLKAPYHAWESVGSVYTLLRRQRRIRLRPARAAPKMARLAGSGTRVEINPILVFTVCATLPLSSLPLFGFMHPPEVPVAFKQSKAKMKEPGPAVVSIVIGAPELRLVGTANTCSLKLVGVPNPFSVSSV